MKPSSELFNLIKSLTKSEKRFFKLSSSLQSGEKNYLKIFDAIDEQSEYDEYALKELFKKEKFVKHFPSEKNHLYKLILKSLRSYYSDNSISSILQQEIKNIEILYRKTLYEECEKFLQRAKKLAIEHEKFYYHFELIGIEKMLLEEAFEDGKFSRSLDDLIEEEQQVITKLRNLAEYHVLYSKVNFAFRSEGYSREENARKIIDEVSENHLIKAKNTALSKSAATICFYTQGFCHSANNQKDLSFIAFKQVQQILDDNPALKRDLIKRYVRTIYNLIKIHIDRKEFRSAFKMIESLREYGEKEKQTSLDIQTRIFRASYMAELDIYDKLGEFEEGLKTIKKIEAQLPFFEGKSNKEHLIAFYLKFSVIYIGLGDFNKSLFWVNKILNDNEKILRQDLYAYARLINLIVHYELNNLDLIEYLIKSTQRFLNKKNRDFELEKVIISYIRKLSKVSDQEKQKEIFIAFRTQLEGLFEDQNNRILLNYFDFLSWVDSKIDSISLADAIQRRHI
jgi:hypothetical protein